MAGRLRQQQWVEKLAVQLEERRLVLAVIGEARGLVDGAVETAPLISEGLNPLNRRAMAPDQADRGGEGAALRIARRLVAEPHAVQLEILVHLRAGDDAAATGGIEGVAVLDHAHQALADEDAQVQGRSAIVGAAVVVRDDESVRDLAVDQPDAELAIAEADQLAPIARGEQIAGGLSGNAEDGTIEVNEGRIGGVGVHEVSSCRPLSRRSG